MTQVTITAAEDYVYIALDHAPLASLLTNFAAALVDHRACEALDQVVDAVRHLESPQRHADTSITEFYEGQRDAALGVLVGHAGVQAAFTTTLSQQELTAVAEGLVDAAFQFQPASVS